MIRRLKVALHLTNAGRTLLIALASLLFAAPELRAQPAEYEVKAAFLLNFIKFVEWPEIESQRSAPIAICIVGDDPFGRTLDQMVEGETVGDRKIAIHRVRAVPETDTTCHLAFLSKSVREAGKLIAGLSTGILTVGEGENFLRDGGMIAFVVDNRRVRFDINTTAIRTAGLRVSSRLLTVARSVEK